MHGALIGALCNGKADRARPGEARHDKARRG